MPEIQSVTFIGFMGSGKSTVGEMAARLLGYEFIDIDREIERKYRTSIPEIFRNYGEKAFREYEYSVLKEVCPHPYTIISCGGGIVIKPENRKLLKNKSFVIWLDCPVEKCISRCKNGNRPLLNDDNVLLSAEKLFACREPFYRQLADMIYDTDQFTAETVAEKISINIKSLMQ